MRIMDHIHIVRPRNKQLNNTVWCNTPVLWNKQIFKYCFLVPRDSEELQNFLKLQLVSDLTPGMKANIDFSAKPNFLVLLSLVPFMRHNSGEKKIVEKHSLNKFFPTFSSFSCPMLPNYTVPYNYFSISSNYVVTLI